MIFNSRFQSMRAPADEGPLDTDVEQLWQAEILRRAREIDEGSVQLVPWSELRSRLMKPDPV
jgi:putative addiction module component (TIGR02574 family)